MNRKDTDGGSGRSRERNERPGGRDRILAAALEVLERDGEAALRFTDIAERADVAVSVITHHFGTREGLVSALHALRYAGFIASDITALQRLADTAADRAQLSAGLAQVTANVVDRARHDVRLARIASIGGTLGRPELANRIRATATELLDAMTDLIATGQANGLLDPDVDARALATFVQAYALGMIVADLDDAPADRDAIAAVITRAIDAFQTDPG